MPYPADRLTPNSTKDQIEAAISASIAMCMREGGRKQDQCAAIAYSKARKATGKDVGK